MPRPFHVITAIMLGFITSSVNANADTRVWDGLWFECEYSGKKAPPRDDCALLDDDGFLFDANQVTYVKMLNSPEEELCKKSRKGQCFKAKQPSINIVKKRQGNAEFTPTTVSLSFMGCSQVYHMHQIKDYIEARPDADRCYWAGEKFFYLRRYTGQINFED